MESQERKPLDGQGEIGKGEDNAKSSSALPSSSSNGSRDHASLSAAPDGQAISGEVVQDFQLQQKGEGADSPPAFAGSSAQQSSEEGKSADLSDLKLGQEEEDGPVKLFVGGLAWETTEESLQKVFENYGKIIELSIMRHPRTFCSRGFGFVTLSNREEAEAACNDKHTIDGRVVEAKISAAPGQNSPGSSQAASKRRKVFVGGLSAETTDDDFRKYFEQFGEISESQILQDHFTGRSRGFGFITFTSEEATEKVFAKGRFHELKGKLVEVKSATPRQQNKGNNSRGMRNNNSTKPQHASNRIGNARRNIPSYGVNPQVGVPYGIDPSARYTAYPGYYPPYNQVMQAPYVYGSDPSVPATAVPAAVPGFSQNAYSMGQFPVGQGGQPGGFIVPPVYNQTFVPPSTTNGKQLDQMQVAQNMVMPNDLTIMQQSVPPSLEEASGLPDAVMNNKVPI